MKVSESTISALAYIATGDRMPSKEHSLSPYLSGSRLVELFNEFGANEQYSQGFPTRFNFAQDQIRRHQGKRSLVELIEALVHPRRFLETDLDPSKAVEYLNKYLAYDNATIVKRGQRFRVVMLSETDVQIELRPLTNDATQHEFICDQLAKCDQKIADGDFQGAITNARTLVESVLRALETKLEGHADDFSGDLPKLAKRVHKLLNLAPDRKDIGDNLRAVLNGLSSIVHGLAPLRNKMSDAHPAVYRSERHHARLTTNAAKTYVEFLVDSLEYQMDKKTIQVPEASSGGGS